MSDNFLCPTCGKPTRVIDSRGVTYDAISMVRRRRKCDEAGHRFTTTEVTGDVVARLKETTHFKDTLRLFLGLAYEK